MRFRADTSLRRFGNVVVGGSPLTLFRLTDAGARMLGGLLAGDDAAPSPLIERLVDAGAVHPRPDVGPFTASDVTVVVPSAGAPSTIAGALLVDDGTPVPIDGAAVRLPDNRGPAAARNAGLARVTTPLVAFVDTDVTVPGGWLDALLPHFTDPRVALVAPRVVTPGEPESPLDLGPHPARVRAGTRVSYVPAAALVCRVDAVRAVGGFDESLRVGEDVDLVWRLDGAGWRCRYEPAAVVTHARRPTWAGRWHQRVAYGASAGPLARRHPGALAPLRANAWSVATWLLAAAGRPAIGTAVGAASAVELARHLPGVPARAACALAATGQARTGEQLAGAIRRAWWPIAALAALRSRRARAVLVASTLAARTPARLADDVAYSVGLWRGAWAARTAAPLVPRITARRPFARSGSYRPRA